jgi:hypothetical protein
MPIPKPSPSPAPLSTVAHLPPHSPTPAPAPLNNTASSDSQAAQVVRYYLQALARGDRATATSYLAQGAPNETFMNAGSHIESIRSASVGTKQYKVTADVQTESGEYYVTFTLEPGPTGLQITEHYSIKPQ